MTIDSTLRLPGIGAHRSGTNPEPGGAELYQRIRAFDIDGGPVAFSFADRLARENNWPTDYAGTVILEYKRFLFLMAVTGHPVTPSDQVDQAWHLHLTYTESYWERLCGGIVGRPLHHVPTIGGEAEARKFGRWYLRTLERYEEVFGHPPPADIWPAASIRFGEDLSFKRVNTARNWVWSKPAVDRRDKQARFGRAAIASLFAAAAFAASNNSGVAQENSDGSSDEMVHPVFWLLVGFFAVVGFGKYVYDRYCPKCSRFQLHKTLEDKTWGSGMMERYACRSCGHRLWREKRMASSSDGCSGCGGCSD